jgi:hypothetical protein
MKERLIRLVEALADGDMEIVVNVFIDDQIIDSIQLTDNGGFICCIWEDDIEYQILSEQLTDAQMLDLIEQLEEILRG